MKGSEERDALFANLFALTSLVHSGCLFRPSSSAETINSAVDELIKLGNVKAWLRESAWWTLLELVKGVEACDNDLQEEVISHVAEQVYGDKIWTQEKVALTLVLEKQRPVSIVSDALDLPC